MVTGLTIYRNDSIFGCSYEECVSNLRKNIFLPLKIEKSIKKKIMWCCYFISPRIMAIRKAIEFKKAANTGGGV